jgi:hypothetical protein
MALGDFITEISLHLRLWSVEEWMQGKGAQSPSL